MAKEGDSIKVITPRTYAKNLEKSQKEFSKRLRDYLKDPKEENVHDLRTSLRRIIAITDVLPRKIRRKGKSQDRISDYQKLLKLNAKVRDMDIILSKIATYEGDNDISQLVKKLEKNRESDLKAAQKFAASLVRSDEFEVEPNRLPPSALRKRFSKIVERLGAKVDERLPVVLKQPEKKEELHRLREDSRRLRYTLELDDSQESDKIKVLESWQDVLGAIHDTDIFTAYFEGAKKKAGNIGALLAREMKSRDDNYERFRSVAKETPSFRGIG